LSKNIVILGTLDTKAPEIEYMKELIEKRGHKAVVMDISTLRPPPFKPDIPSEEVAEAGGVKILEVRATKDRNFAMEVMGRGGAKILKDRYESNNLDGVLAVGGAQGFAIASMALRALPIGVPKVSVSTIASGNIRPFVGNKDIMVMFSVADIMGGINTVTETILSNAVGAVVGMVEVGARMQPPWGKNVVALTTWSTTHTAVTKSSEILRKKGYEIVMFHASGACGSAMEDLIDQGVIKGVLDITTHELVGEVFGDDLYTPVKLGRLEAAGRMGIPQVIAPGGLNFFVLGALETLPPKYRNRKYIRHNPLITLVRLTKQELENLGEVVAEKLNKARGPTAMCIPTLGWNDYDKEGMLTYDPKSNKALIQSLKKHVKPQVKVLELEAHLNDPIFAEKIAEMLDRFMKVHSTNY